VQTAQFSAVMERMIGEDMVGQVCKKYAPVPRTPPKLTAPQLVSAYVYHQLQEGGTLADHGAELHGTRMSNAAYSQRRRALPVEMFEAICANALRPLADASRHPDCFFEGLRLLVADGSQSSVQNTPVLKEQLPKAASRRGKAAFAKVRFVCLVEMGTHAPIAVVVAPASEGEQTLARRLWSSVPGDSLTILDRLFGTARTLDEAISGSEGRRAHFLVRVKANIKVKLVEQLPDGSSLVDVPVKEGSKVIKYLRLREINAAGIGRDGKKFTLRLWVTLLDPALYSAERLARQYAERREAEMYYRELKLDVRGEPVLASHTLETALQEVLALVLATAVLAHLRVEAAERLEMPVRRVSFFKLLLATRKLWHAYEMAGTDLPAHIHTRIWNQFVDDVQHTALLPKRRSRSCPRALRQPVSKWPRMIDQPSHKGEVTLEVVPSSGT
jgi:hypothetical protein